MANVYCRDCKYRLIFEMHPAYGIDYNTWACLQNSIKPYKCGLHPEITRNNTHNCKDYVKRENKPWWKRLFGL